MAISVKDYDKMKNCTTDLDKRPMSIEYLTYFNCGRVSSEDGTTPRVHAHSGRKSHNTNFRRGAHFSPWTFYGSVPGPTMRITEGDHVRITVVNSNASKHTHTLHVHSIHRSTADGVE